MTLAIAFVTAVFLVPTVELASAGAASASAYPDNAAQPVPFGDAGFFGSMAGVRLAAPVVGMASTSDTQGYWMVAADGGVFSFGDAGSYGSMGGQRLAAPVVGMAATADGKGYWLVASDGGVFCFGDAPFLGSMGGKHLNAPIVGIARTPSGHGYWLVASDGGVFSYGDAQFFGSTGAQRLNAPVVGMAPAPGGGGYWLVASDGGVFSYGTAPFLGSTGAIHLAAPVVGMATTPSGHGYWLVGSDGGVFSYGDAPFLGSMGAQALQNPIAAITATPDGGGYWLLPSTQIATATLAPGATGQAVLALQQRLSSLGYWLGTPDGTFGDSTEQAVYALQKAAGLSRNGVVGPSTQAALADGVLPQPRSTSGYVIEVDLEDDLVMFVTNGTIDEVLNTSTGGGYTYTEDGVTSVADTPTGHFEIYRQVNGLVVDSLGSLWRPKFFDAGFAIHGDSSVPPYPVSHGCARVSNEAIDWIWANNLAPIGTAVWVY
jgi:hypothetical protein